ncbi:hypothetical protein [Pseudoxanthomonas mexicana]|uniref:hypothetical protein n=1 Tax=Pseudoxanthomonas mexicana TaxID=128785 RepID=UPI00398AC033
MSIGHERLKSCPECSGQAGRHVFYPESHFGMREMGDGRRIVQSWCPDCRSRHPSTAQPAYTCP